MTVLTAWNAFPVLDRIFDDVVNGVGGTAPGTATIQQSYSPAIDVRVSAEEIVFLCDVPGLKRDDIDVSIEADTLTIRGHRRYEGGEKDRVWLGRRYGSFEKSFTLPDLVDAEHMTAELSDGVLTIRVPKKPQAKPRRIEIGGGHAPRQLGEKKKEEE